MVTAQARAEHHEQAVRTAHSERAAAEWGGAATAWAAAREPELALACWVRQAEAYEALAADPARGDGIRAADCCAAAEAWARARDPEREAAALVRGAPVRKIDASRQEGPPVRQELALQSGRR